MRQIQRAIRLWHKGVSDMETLDQRIELVLESKWWAHIKRDFFMRLLGEAKAEIASLRRELEQKNGALEAARKYIKQLSTRIEFAALPIGACSHCFYTGNKPGAHHLSDCPAFIAEGGE